MSGWPASNWILASSNRGKLAEYQRLLADAPIQLLALDPDSADIPDETGASFVENALIKARHASLVSGKPALADDSGLCVAALGGAPGVHSARYAGTGASDSDNLLKLLAELEDTPSGQRDAAFYCVIVALLSPDDPAPIIATGRWPGQITGAARGTAGFGYDPVFLDPELGLTAAELSPEDKNARSHRGRAVAELRRLIGA